MSSADSERYDIFFAGECLEGRNPQAVRAALGRLFKADEQTLDRLFCGQRQRIKGECDTATANKYRQALTAAGAKVSIAPAAGRVAAAGASSPPASAAAASSSPAGAAASSSHAGAAASSPPAAAPDSGRLTLADAGERLGPASADVAALTPPDFDLAEVGADLGPPPSPAPPAPDTSGLSLAGEGGDLSDCAPEPAPAPALDLSHMELAEAGSDLLSEAERQRPQAAAPDTAHLSLEPGADPAQR